MPSSWATELTMKGLWAVSCMGPFRFCIAPAVLSLNLIENTGLCVPMVPYEPDINHAAAYGFSASTQLLVRGCAGMSQALCSTCMSGVVCLPTLSSNFQAKSLFTLVLTFAQSEGGPWYSTVTCFCLSGTQLSILLMAQDVKLGW